MTAFDAWLLLATFVGLLSGGWAIFWARTAADSARRLWGRWLFVVTLCFLGAGGLVAAWQHADGLVPLGLSAGFLVIGMLVENPAQRSSMQTRDSAVEILTPDP